MPKLPARYDEAAQLALEQGEKRVSVLPPEALPEPAVSERLRRDLERRGARVTAYLDAPCKRSHGRFERREAWLLYDPELNAYLGTSGDVGEPWPYAQQVCWLKRERLIKPGEWTVEVSYAMTSVAPEIADARWLVQMQRDYWAGVENGSHCVRDITFQEDASRVRTGSAPQVMAAARNLVLALLRRHGAGNIAAALRMYAARCSDAVNIVLGLPPDTPSG